MDRKSPRKSFVTGSTDLPVKIHATVCGIVWFVILFLPGCSGCLSKTVEDAAKQQTKQQQNETQPEQRQPNQPTAGETASVQQRVDTATAAEKPAKSAANQSPDSPAPTSPTASFSQGKMRYQQSQRKSQAGDAAGAFQDATAAWNLVRRFPKDPDCRRLEGEIAGQLEKLARKANEKVGGSSGIEGKTLIEE